jgi:hypothetical protein
MIRQAYYVIKSFAEVDNNFKQIFMDLQARMKDFLFLSDFELSVHYKIKEGCSCKKALKIVDKYSRDAISKRDGQI